MKLTTAQQVAKLLTQQQLQLVTAESCTGGTVASTLTEIAGSSQWFERGFVTYTNQAKQEMLGVKALTLNQFGAVSRETAVEMATGALQHSHGQVSLAMTGIAGPTGGSPQKPVGTVWFAWAQHGRFLQAHKRVFAGDRHAVRYQAAQYSLERLISLLKA